MAIKVEYPLVGFEQPLKAVQKIVVVLSENSHYFHHRIELIIRVQLKAATKKKNLHIEHRQTTIMR